MLKAGHWYVVGALDGTSRIFKISSIRAMDVRDATFERPDDFDLAAFWSAELTRFETGLRPLTASAMSGAEPPDADGWTRIRLPIETLDHAALLLLGAGPEIEVLAPPALRQRVGALATAVADRQR